MEAGGTVVEVTDNEDDTPEVAPDTHDFRVLDHTARREVSILQSSLNTLTLPYDRCHHPLVTMDATTNTDTITRDMGCDPRPSIRVMDSSKNTEQIVMGDSACDPLPPSTTDTGPALELWIAVRSLSR